MRMCPRPRTLSYRIGDPKGLSDKDGQMQSARGSKCEAMAMKTTRPRKGGADSESQSEKTWSLDVRVRAVVVSCAGGPGGCAVSKRRSRRPSQVGARALRGGGGRQPRWRLGEKNGQGGLTMLKDGQIFRCLYDGSPKPSWVRLEAALHPHKRVGAHNLAQYGKVISRLSQVQIHRTELFQCGNASHGTFARRLVKSDIMYRSLTSATATSSLSTH
ncbi:hypothetical protein C8Q74DRAFT_825001 [Fomes fomentarius]|nr:hypothetical protein C8Q74DRAFT_825001 [Fomes fomentarius]